MLNVFPELLSFGLLSATIIRVTIAIILLVIGYETVTKKRLDFDSYFKTKEFPMASVLSWKLGVAEIIVGIFLLVGLYTQIATLIAVFLFFALLHIENEDKKILPHTSTFYLIMVVISTTLLFSGAGAFAIDLPL